VKWNGLSYIALLLVMSVLLLFIKLALKRDWLLKAESAVLTTARQVGLIKTLLVLLLIPGILYCLLWIPDRMFNTTYSFLEIHSQSLGYHANTVTADEHPYCSRAWQWPVMYKPINYYFNSTPVNTPEGDVSWFQDVHLFGNPALYWLSTLAVLVMSIHWLLLLGRTLKNREIKVDTLIMAGILAGFYGNLLPWLFVSRCIFFYHYQSSALFSFLALGWYLTSMFSGRNKTMLTLAGVALSLIIAAFIYWLPFSLGLEITSDAFYQRMWWSSWI
jgi:dolichyl-phosphate-mannose--protein O-mannosyl transferase